MIKKEEVRHIAKLARVGLKENEIEKFQKDMTSILDYFNSLKEVDTSDIEPTFHPTKDFFKEKLRQMREDKFRPQPAELVSKLTTAAPDKKKGHFKVKAIL